MIHGLSHNYKRKARIFLGLLGLALLACPPHGFAQSDQETDNRLSRMENEIETLSRAVYKGEQPPAGSFSGGSSGSAADTEVRLQQMETDMRDLRGKVEEQANDVRQLKEQLERATSDMALRLNDLEGGAHKPAGAQDTAPDDPNAKYQRDSANESEPSAQTEPASGNGGYRWETDKAGSAAKGTSEELGSVKTSSTGTSGGDEAANMYEEAFANIKSNDYPAAQEQFKAFLEQYPTHALAGNAKYWLGETYYAKGKYEDAARIFAEGYQKYPKGSKSADNLLKLGLSLDALGKKQDACTALKQLKKENVTGAAPVMNQAAQEMTRLGCS